MKTYRIDEFISPGIKTTDTLEDVVDKKISLLYDFCILKRDKYTKKDQREELVRTMLTECGTEQRITALLHDVLADRISLDELLKRNEVFT